MVMMNCSFELISKCLWCTFAHSPLTFLWIATVFCKVKWGHIIYVFGMFFCKDSNGEVLMMCCATHEIKVWSPDPEAFKSFCLQHYNFSVFEMLFIWSCQVMFHVFFFFKSALAYWHVQYGWFPTVVAPSWVSSSPTLLRLRNHRFTFMLFKFL